MRFVHHKTPLLKNAIQYGKANGVETRSAIRIAHQVWDGVIQAANAEKASLILMGWKGYTTNRDRIMGEVTDKVVHHTPCDLITVKLLGNRPIRRILLPTAGGPHASLAAEYVGLLQEGDGVDITCCYVIHPDTDEDGRQIALQRIHGTVRGSKLTKIAAIELLEGKRVASTLVKAAADYDLLVMGSSQEGIFSSVLFGEIPERVARYAQTPVMIVKRYEGRVKSLIKRIMG